MRILPRWIPLLFLQFAFQILAHAQPLVATNAVWRFFKGTTEASSPDPTSWRQLSFDDRSWASGRAPFYYGEPITGGTALSDMVNRYTSIFLRKTFRVDNPELIASLEIDAISDDGFILWVNGVELRRENMPAGAVSFNGLAAGNATEPVAYTKTSHSNIRGLLAAGDNVVAVQAFNVNSTSSDLVIDARLTGVPPDATPPWVASVVPGPGPLTRLNEMVVTFSEPVSGVDRLDLMVNEVAATSVSGFGSTYTFVFAQPEFGFVRVRWDPNHAIADQARNAFDESTVAWDYQLLDTTRPTLISIHPPPGRALRQLSQVEVRFNEPVEGVDAADLRVNGRPAATVRGFSAGPYVFEFPAGNEASVQVEWVANHEITDMAESPNSFGGGSWQYPVDSSLLDGDLVLNEFSAANATGLKDEELDFEDWVEIYNRGTTAVNLEGWSLTDDMDDPGQWVFPAVSVPPGQFLVVFASGKDRKVILNGVRLHTNFKLSASGEEIGLFNAESPRRMISEIKRYPGQRPDYSYGQASDGSWRYYRTATPGQPNGDSPIDGVTPPVHFSVPRGYYDIAFNLALSCPSTAAQIRYTLDGSVPTEASGIVYTEPILIDRIRMVRAAAFEPGRLPSATETHTFLYNIPSGRRTLPALSLVTDTNHLFGRTGIMSINPRNTTKRGIAWERPVSAEWIRPEDNGGFALDAGIRVQGGNYVRERYNPSGGLPFSKYSFRLYFRGDYGQSKLEYPLFSQSPVQEFDHVVLRAGMNDHTNPFINDELVRRLATDTGQVACHGNLALLFINGVYKGYYNPTERIDGEFLASWHGGGEDWDVIAQFDETREGTATEWNSLRNFISARDLTIPVNYEEVSRRLDLENFVDYLLVNIYAATGDWPHNNWRAARQRVPGAKFRFYHWDAEWSFGLVGNPVTHNTLNTELNSATYIGTFYRKLKANPEFRLLFADRIQKHFFNQGALTDTNVLNRYNELRASMRGVLSSMSTVIPSTWIPQRRSNIMRHFGTAGLIASTNAPVLSQHGGQVPHGYVLGLKAAQGTIYFTTNRVDPRVPFTGAVSPDAIRYQSGIPLETGTVIKARTLNGTNWSALTLASFEVAQLGLPLRVSEIMFNPAGGDSYEFLELSNYGTSTIDLSFFSFDGVEFSFPDGSRIAPGESIVLSSGTDTAAFAARYPGVRVTGRFSGSLSNGGETIVLKDRAGATVTSVSYDDENGWPTAADGSGKSLEIIDWNGDPDDAANWRASVELGGSPGALPPAPKPSVVFNEIMAENLGAVPRFGGFPDWIELANTGLQSVSISGWSLTDDPLLPRRFVFPPNVTIPPGGYLLIWLDDRLTEAGLHTGFSLGKNGETLLLLDGTGGRMDAISFGPQIADRSLGRVGDKWVLTVPTPEAANAPAPLSSPSSLRINEWMANPFAGQEDWFELHNRDTNNPVALRGLYLATSNVVFQISSHSFVSPGGFILFHADENPGPDHVDFKLPAGGGQIVLFDWTATEIDRVKFGSQIEGVSHGKFPDGGSNIVSFPGTASPGATNYQLQYNGPILNEIMAKNETGARNSAGRPADWIELFNSGASSADLAGMSLRLQSGQADEWTFPPGSSIPAGGYLVVWFDINQPASLQTGAEFNTGMALPDTGGELLLLNSAGQAVDRVAFGFQIADLSIGRTSIGWRLLNTSTPGRANALAAVLGDLHQVKFNEWQADPEQGNDWIELYNPELLPIDLSGSYLSDDPSVSGKTNYLIGPLTFAGSGGWVRWEADGNSLAGPDHLNFSLDRLGETLRLYGPSLRLIDGIDFSAQALGSSQGRLPDGSSNIVTFTVSVSPGASNFLPVPQVVINELLSHTDPPLEDAVELYNPTRQAVDLSGWFLSDELRVPHKFRIPDGTVLGPRQFLVFYQFQFDPTPEVDPSFTFNSARGDQVHLSAADAQGQLTGYRASVEFGAAENGVSFGRVETSRGQVFTPQSRRTLGQDNPVSLNEFRLGKGLPNSVPRVGPVVINEIMYQPVNLVGTNRVENTNEEFIELINISDQATPLFDQIHATNCWRIAGGVNFEFPRNQTLSARETVLVVGFDPVADAAVTTAFRNRYALPGSVRLFGPFRGKLDNRGEVIELLKPDPPQTREPDLGYVPYVQIDRIAYQDSPPWPPSADGQGASLQRRFSASFGQEPLNWAGANPTPGRPNGPFALTDSDGDKMPDDWEIASGLDPKSSADALIDSDGDGASNLHEFLSGTYAANAQSRFEFESVLIDNGGIVLQFPAYPERAYEVQFTDSIAQADWKTLKRFEPGSSVQMLAVTDPATPLGARFYRVTIVQP